MKFFFSSQALYFLENGANALQVEMGGNTPLHLAASAGSLSLSCIVASKYDTKSKCALWIIADDDTLLWLLLGGCVRRMESHVDCRDKHGI